MAFNYLQKVASFNLVYSFNNLKKFLSRTSTPGTNTESHYLYTAMEIRPLSADLEAIARQELNEDPARLEQDLKHIRDWLAKQPHLTARTGMFT